MNRNIRGIAAAVAGLGMAAALVASPAAATPVIGNWGLWEMTPLTASDITGTITFGDSAQGALDVTVSDWFGNTFGAYTETSNEKGDWIPVGSPAANIFGATGPSDTDNMLIMDSSDEVVAGFTLTFKEPVSANNLGVVVMDIDSDGNSDETESDRLAVAATTADGATVTGAELNSGVFNECDVAVTDMPDECGGTTDSVVPTATVESDRVNFMGDLTQGDTGASGWINPTVAVKSVTLTWASYASGSSIRVFIAVKPTPAALPNTGVDVTSGLLAALAFGVLGAAAVIITRRRQA